MGRPDTSPFAPSEFPQPLMNNFVSVGNRESVFFVSADITTRQGLLPIYVEYEQTCRARLILCSARTTARCADVISFSV